MGAFEDAWNGTGPKAESSAPSFSAENSIPSFDAAWGGASSMDSAQPEDTSTRPSWLDAARYVGLQALTTGAKAADALNTINPFRAITQGGYRPNSTETSVQDLMAQIFGKPSEMGIVVPNSVPQPMPEGGGTLGSNLWEGVRTLPRSMVDVVGSIPSGIDNLSALPGNLSGVASDAVNLAKSDIFGSVFTPSGVDYPRTERTLGGIGDLAAQTAGYLAGGPITAAAAKTGYDKLKQGLDIAPITSAEQDFYDLTKGIGANVAAQAVTSGVKGVANAVEEAPNTLRNIGNALDRRSIGARQSDYGSNADSVTIEDPITGDISSSKKVVLNDLLERGKLGASRSPSEMLKVVEAESKPLISAIDSEVNSYDANPTKGPAQVNFDNALEHVYSGKVPADLIPAYIKRLDALDGNIISEGQGKLSFVQQQKVALGRAYNHGDTNLAMFDRAIYKDLQNAVEDYAPGVAPLNTELAKYIVTEPIIKRALRVSEARDIGSTLRNLTYTTGGISAPAIIGSTLGGPVGAAAGVGVGLTGRFLASPRGQAIMAKGFRNLSSATAPVGSIAGVSKIANVAQAAKLPAQLAAGQRQAPSISAMFDKKTPESKKKVPPAVMEQIKADPYYGALAQAESKFDPNAKNKDSTAKGLFQFIDGTAKTIGLKDPYDPAQSFEAVKKLTKENGDRFKTSDPAVLYSAHYLGANVLDRYLKNKPLTDKETKQVNYLKDKALPDFMAVYNGGA